MKKLLCMLLTCCMLLSLLNGCGKTTTGGNSGTGQDEQVSITFAGWGELYEKEVYTDLIDEFMKQNPNIKVNYQHYPGTKDAYIVKMISNIAANKLPDAFYLPTQDFIEWAEAGRLRELDSYLESSDTYTEGMIWEQAMKMFRYNSETSTVGEDGTLYGLPKDLSVRVLVYNADLFKANNVSTPDPKTPMTYSEYITKAKQLTSGSGAAMTYGSGYYLVDLAVWANGASFLSEDRKTVTVDTPEFAEALQWVADLNLVHEVAPNQTTSSTTQLQRFLNGKLGMMIIGSWQIATLRDDVDFEFDIAPIPMNEKTGLSTTWLDSAALCVSKSTTDEKAEAAYKLIEFISMNEDSQRINYESGQAIPNIIEMAENEFLEMDSMPSNKELFVNYLKDSTSYRIKDYYYMPDIEWYDYFESHVSSVYSGEQTAKEFLKEIQPVLQEMLDKNN